MTNNTLFARYITKNTLDRKLKEKFNLPIEALDQRQISRISRSVADMLTEVSDDQLIDRAINEAL